MPFIHHAPRARLSLVAHCCVQSVNLISAVLGMCPLYMQRLTWSCPCCCRGLVHVPALLVPTSMGMSLSTPARQLLTAARQGDHQQVDTLLQQDPGLIHACTLFRQSTVLHLAASNNLPELITTSLSPYVAAAQREVQANCACGPALQQLRRLVDARDAFYCTPFLTAVKKGSVPCARVLAERAANLLSEDRDGNSALHLAAFHGQTAAVEFLVDKTRDRGILHRWVIPFLY